MKNFLIDTHCHLNFSDFKKDLDQVVKNALTNGVGKIICVSSNLADSQKAIDIVRHCPSVVYAAVGIHPQQTDPENTSSLDKQINILRELAQKKEVVAIGECGLDFAPAPRGEKERTPQEQQFLFEEQIKLATELNLPIIVHSRKAAEQTMDILKKYFSASNKSNGVWHFYSGGKSKIKEVVNMGFYFGIDGNITYEEGIQNVISEIPLEKIILETDSPFLTPKPYRGLRNTPANVKIIAESLACLQGVSFEKVCQTTSHNAQTLFSKAR
ncbi:MAG: TatD family hydrolase [bacterium]|nr:TatD family hydrolase [bacterium]